MQARFFPRLGVGQPAPGGGADGADAMAREWVLYNKEIMYCQIETITKPNYLMVRRL